MAKILITGAAGFIGRHVAGALLARGDKVRRLYDALIAQVHAGAATPPPPGAELMVGDIRDARKIADAPVGIDKKPAPTPLAARRPYSTSPRRWR